MSYSASMMATTINKYGKKMHDNVFDGKVLLFQLRRNGRQRPVDGGLQIVEPIEYKQNTTFDWRGPKAGIPLTEQDPFMSATYDWKTVDGAVVLFDDDEWVNRGESQIVDIVRAKIENAEKTMKDKIGVGMFADGNPTTEIDGLEIAVGTGTYAGIDPTAEGMEFWKSTVLSTSEVYAIEGGVDGGLRRLYQDVTQGGKEEPDLIITEALLWRKHNSLLAQNQRFQDPKMAEAGFRNLMFDNAPIVWDVDSPSGIVYVLNTNHLNLRPHSLCSEKFITRERHPSEGMFATSMLMLWKGNITCTNRRFQGKMTGKTYS